jgi:hypothetical protein
VATTRLHAHLRASADEVWALIRDPASITDWLPGVDGVEMDGDTRIVSTSGMKVSEDCFVDDELRRFRYKLTEEPPGVEFQLATIDVLELDGDGGCIVLYSIDVEPEDALGNLDGVLTNGIAGLRQRFG